MAKIETKECIKCNKDLPMTEFYKSSQYSGGKDYYCKFCRNGSTIKSHNNNFKDKRCSVDDCGSAHYAKGYCRLHHARVQRTGSPDTTTFIHNFDEVAINGPYKVTITSASGKQYHYNKTTKFSRADYLMFRFNLTKEQYEKMSKNGCMICNDVPERNLHVDHDHACCESNNRTCGKCVRGVVCNKCNTLIGHYEKGTIRIDNPLYDKVGKYLDKYNKNRAKKG
jgi:hypothetical protein